MAGGGLSNSYGYGSGSGGGRARGPCFGAAVDRAAGRLATVEAWVGAFFTSLLTLGLGIPLLAGSAAIIVGDEGGEFSPTGRVAILAAAFVWLLANLPHLFWTWSCVRRGDRPLAPAVALRQRPAEILVLRPFVALWWLAHFAFGAAAAWFTHGLTPPGLADGQRPLGYALLMAATALAYTWAANGYLLMAVTALTRSERWVRRAWSWRLVTDLAITALAVLAPAASRVVP